MAETTTTPETTTSANGAVAAATASLGLTAPPVGETPAPIVTGTPLSALLPPELQQHPAYGRYKDKDVATLFRSYGDLEKKLGERPSGLLPLTETSTPEQVAEYRKALGVPEQPDGYQLTLPAYPDAAPLTDEMVTWWRQTAHELHLTPKQAQTVLDRHAVLIAQQWDALQTQRLEQRQALGTLLKESFGVNAEPAVTMAFEHLRRTHPDVMDDFFEGTITEGIAQPLGPKALVALVKILQENAKLTGNDVFVQGDSRGGFLTQATAQQQIDELRAKHRMKQVSDDEYTREFNRLAPVAYGG